MDEFISKEAIRNALYEADAINMNGVAIINQFPDADVAPVVHCKDCRYCYKEDDYTLWCQGRGSPVQLVPPDGFCDRGART